MKFECPKTITVEQAYIMLNVDEFSTKNEVKKAFCALSTQVHPDVYDDTTDARNEVLERILFATDMDVRKGFDVNITAFYQFLCMAYNLLK